MGHPAPRHDTHCGKPPPPTEGVGDIGRPPVGGFVGYSRTVNRIPKSEYQKKLETEFKKKYTGPDVKAWKALTVGDAFGDILERHPEEAELGRHNAAVEAKRLLADMQARNDGMRIWSEAGDTEAELQKRFLADSLPLDEYARRIDKIVREHPKDLLDPTDIVLTREQMGLEPKRPKQWLWWLNITGFWAALIIIGLEVLQGIPHPAMLVFGVRCWG